jgi:hypothetical protein
LFFSWRANGFELSEAGKEIFNFDDVKDGGNYRLTLRAMDEKCELFILHFLFFN